MMYAGDEGRSDEQQRPGDDIGPFGIGQDTEGWPTDYPCEGCGARAGEDCRRYCTA